MRVIVISKVFRYKAFIIALALVSILAFFQSNQSLNETSSNPEGEDVESTENKEPETPSIPDTPDLPDKPDLPDAEENEDSTSKARISISIITNTQNGEANTSLDIDTEPEIPLGDLEEDLKDGNINIDLETDHDGHFEVDFDSDVNQDTVNKFSVKQRIRERQRSD